MAGAHVAHGARPFIREARPLIAAPGALEIRERRVVILAFPSVDYAHSLGAPEASGEAWMSLLQLLRRRLGCVVAPPPHCFFPRGAPPIPPAVPLFFLH